MSSTPRVRVVSGAGRYTDPWHPFAETSAAIAEVVRELGWSAEVVPTEPAALGDLDGVDLVVIDAGGNPRVDLAPHPVWSAAFEGFADWLRAGHPVLGVHAAANAFPDWPDWPALLGGRWVRGRSMHPPRSEARFEAVPEAIGHPALGGLTEVDTYDERYSFLEIASDSTPLLRHTLDGIAHPVIWLGAAGRSAYDALGHDARAYTSPGRRRLLAAELSWLLDPRAAVRSSGAGG